MNEAEKSNLEALKGFLREAKTELEKEDFEALEVTLNQARGKVRNILTLEGKPKTALDEELELLKNWKKDPKKLAEKWFSEHVRSQET